MATHFYQVKIVKVPVGTAVEYRLPSLQGTLQRTVTQTGSRSDEQLVVMDADDSQHQANLALANVSPLEAEAALALAPQYQPQRMSTRFDPLTQTETKVEIPAADLTPFVRKQSPSRQHNA